MTNVRISKKAKALLKRNYSSAKVAEEIVMKSKELSTSKGIKVDFKGRILTLRAVSSIEPKQSTK